MREFFNTTYGTNIMVDLETASTENNAAILTIGATKVRTYEELYTDEELPEEDSLYLRADFEKQFTEFSDNAFHVSRSTMDWWDSQPPLVRAEAFTGDISIQTVLECFAKYLRRFPAPVYIWGNGSDFDNVILRMAYDTCGIQVPWEFRNNRCYRTMKNLVSCVKSPKNTNAHNSLSDARTQAAHLESILHYLADNCDELGS